MKSGTSLISPGAHTTQRVRRANTRKPVSVHTKLGGINVYLPVLLHKEVQTVNKATVFLVNITSNQDNGTQTHSCDPTSPLFVFGFSVQFQIFTGEDTKLVCR